MNIAADAFREWLAPLPLIAILRGVKPSEVAEVGAALIDNGFRAIEVPLNSPDPYQSIGILCDKFGDRALIGAGTVRDIAEITDVAAAGAALIVMPHCNADLIDATKRAGLACVPGVATPSEGFAALSAGADALKLFPGEAIGPAIVKAWCAVFPTDTWLLPVGGISPDRLEPYLRAGAKGFGIGSALYRPGISANALNANAARFSATYAGLGGGADGCP